MCQALLHLVARVIFMKTKSSGSLPLVSHATYYRLKCLTSEASSPTTRPLSFCRTPHLTLTCELVHLVGLHLPFPSQMPMCPLTARPHISLLPVLPLVADSHFFFSASKAFCPSLGGLFSGRTHERQKTTWFMPQAQRNLPFWLLFSCRSCWRPA